MEKRTWQDSGILALPCPSEFLFAERETGMRESYSEAKPSRLRFIVFLETLLFTSCLSKECFINVIRIISLSLLYSHNLF